jgi:hypothetical protein
MRTTPQLYYDVFVLPNLHDYETDPTIARAYNAAATASYLADVTLEFYKKNDPTSQIAQFGSIGDFVEHLTERENYFRIIRSVATVYRHLYNTDSKYNLPSPGPERIVVPAIDSELVKPDGVLDIIFRRPRDGMEFSLNVALKAVIEKMWPNVLPPEDKVPNWLS